MNREIKFRYWYSGHMCMVGSCAFFENGTYHINDELIGGILLQYTGLKDKNGKEIYEGAILRFVGGTCDFLPYGYAHEPHRVGVVFCVQNIASGFTLCLPRQINSPIPNEMGKVDNYTFWNHQKSFEIIGNIYETPELLK